jgi:uncharacterized protein (TIGR02118 family)
MIKVSVHYPNTPGSRFDVEYYTSVHMPTAVRLLGTALKDVSVEIGIGGGVPGDPAPFAAIAGFTCESVDAFTAAFMPVADQLQNDIPKYTDITPIIQISELKRI